MDLRLKQTKLLAQFTMLLVQDQKPPHLLYSFGSQVASAF